MVDHGMDLKTGIHKVMVFLLLYNKHKTKLRKKNIELCIMTVINSYKLHVIDINWKV